MLKMKTFSKSLGFSVEKLEDVSLENVAGGSGSAEDATKELTAALGETVNILTDGQPDPNELQAQAQGLLRDAAAFQPASTPGAAPIPRAWIALTAVGAAGAVGCSIASAICKAVSVHAMNKGNIATASRCSKAAIGLGACVAPFVVAGTVGGIGIGMSRHRG